MSEEIQVKISQESVQQIIKAHVQVAVMNALKPHSEQLCKELVEKSLLSKNENSEFNRYKRDHEKITVLEEIVQRMIAEEAAAAIKAWAEGHREEIAENIRKSLATSSMAKKWALSMVDAMLAASVYSFKVEVKVNGKNE